jgi:hypothetical protein
MSPDINSPRVQSWNVTVEQQIGSAWQAAASYLGSYSDRLWGQVAINPGMFLGTRPLHAARRDLPVVHRRGKPGSAARPLARES